MLEVREPDHRISESVWRFHELRHSVSRPARKAGF
jgi:hypothetical protein